MKKLSFVIILFFTISFVNAQYVPPCKCVKIGMGEAEVLKAAGPPTDSVFLGYDVENNVKSPIVMWNYGNQQVAFEKNVVSGITADVKKSSVVMKQFENKEITGKELKKRLDKINKESCK